MAYEFDLTRPLDDELRRIALERVDHALGQIDTAGVSDPERVHEIRKDCKKLRGLLRLVRPAVPELYKQENAAFRDVAAELSRLRDAEAAIETFDALIAHFRANLAPESLLPIRRALESHHERLAANIQPLGDQLQATGAVLAEARERVLAWSLPGVSDEDAGWPLIGPGLAKTYKRGRRAMAKADAEPSVETFHDWRKRAKYLRYHIRLLRPAWPKLLKATHREVKRLGDWLGDAHDIAVLEQTLADAEDLSPSGDNEKTLLALAAQRRAQLRQQAHALGVRLYAEKPKHLERRMRSYWQHAR
ncbi:MULTISPECIES: CHAD domain-containing protein [Thiorhodovibrio]|uniref:CHAD domain-containing protein n=1 Tax=Thiorhodovibrio TaxID=61593 RepID=UPI001911E924|nr:MULTISPECIES: CHAD domain-containing protein [Thiorhodovibrio]MBK5969132.1 hypothetical protein [Thiorhodovibrio winogradskyi]WPL13395.1 hypothetical protein Thiosp_03196 [Thiorhodovibrio litoralis]